LAFMPSPATSATAAKKQDAQEKKKKKLIINIKWQKRVDIA